MYQVLYRKWRPQVFSDVVGQPQVTLTLKNELKLKRIAHAYLFTGSRGTGKTTCAKILSKAVNCLNPRDGDPCGECEICVGIDNGSIMDVVEIDAASNNGVENIRTLREEASFTPASAKYRVYIIDEVHMLSTGAFNALLKTLEEPPPHVVFILATTEVHKLPATILSRCQRFDFNRIAPDYIAERLEFVASQENASINRDAALLIAKISDGALRDALSLFDQCLGRNRNVDVNVVSETAGLAGNDHLFDLVDAVCKQDAKHALSLIDKLYNSSIDMARLCEELISYFRNIMIIKAMDDASDLIVLSPNDFLNIKKQAESLRLEEVIHAIDTLQDTLGKMFKGGNRRVEVEMCMIKLCSPSLDDTKDSLIRRIALLEKSIKSFENNGLTQNKTTKNSKSSSKDDNKKNAHNEDNELAKNNLSIIEQPNEPTSVVDMDDLQKNAKVMTQWPEVLQILKGYSHTIATAFYKSTAYISGDFVLINSDNQMAFELLRKSAQRDKMRIAIKEVTGRLYKLGPYNSPESTRLEEQDPLNELSQLAKDAGIDIKQI